jgi:hypothetical protein
MRQTALYLFLVLVAAASLAAAEDTLDSLKARLAKASVDDTPEISIHIAQLQLRAADKFYDQGRFQEAQSAVADIVTYTEKARDAAIQSKKHLKNVEIAARKMSAKLRDIKRTLAYDDQPAVDQAIHRLEETRTTLLKEMFSDKKGNK